MGNVAGVTTVGQQPIIKSLFSNTNEPNQGRDVYFKEHRHPEKKQEPSLECYKKKQSQHHK